MNSNTYKCFQIVVITPVVTLVTATTTVSSIRAVKLNGSVDPSIFLFLAVLAVWIEGCVTHSLCQSPTLAQTEIFQQ